MAKKKKSSEKREEKKEKKQEEEKKLEEIAEEQDDFAAEDFSEFIASSGEMPAPSLKQSFQTQDTGLEEGVKDTQLKDSDNNKTQAVYTRAYNEPDYSGAASEQEIAERELRKRGRMARTDNIVETMPRITPSDFEHLREMASGGKAIHEMESDYVVEVERIEDENKLPFEQKRKYREVRR